MDDSWSSSFNLGFIAVYVMFVVMCVRSLEWARRDAPKPDTETPPKPDPLECFYCGILVPLRLSSPVSGSTDDVSCMPCMRDEDARLYAADRAYSRKHSHYHRDFTTKSEAGSRVPGYRPETLALLASMRSSVIPPNWFEQKPEKLMPNRRAAMEATRKAREARGEA